MPTVTVKQSSYDQEYGRLIPGMKIEVDDDTAKRWARVGYTENDLSDALVVQGRRPVEYFGTEAQRREQEERNAGYFDGIEARDEQVLALADADPKRAEQLRNRGNLPEGARMPAETQSTQAGVVGENRPRTSGLRRSQSEDKE
jgi:hypothetical protein